MPAVRESSFDNDDEDEPYVKKDERKKKFNFCQLERKKLRVRMLV